MLARSAFRSTHGTSKQERGQLHVSPFRETRCLWRRNTARVRSRIILSVLATAQILSNYELGAAAAGHPCGALAPWPPLSFAPSTASQARVSQRITSTRSYSRGPRPPPTCGTIFSSTSSGNQAGTRITQTMCYDLKAAQNSIVLPPPTEQRVKTIDDKPVCSQCLKPSFFSKQDQSWHQASDCRGDSPLGSSNSRTSVDVDASGVPYTTRISTSPHIQSPSLTHANTSTSRERDLDAHIECLQPDTTSPSKLLREESRLAPLHGASPHQLRARPSTSVIIGVGGIALPGTTLFPKSGINVNFASPLIEATSSSARAPPLSAGTRIKAHADHELWRKAPSAAQPKLQTNGYRRTSKQAANLVSHSTLLEHGWEISLSTDGGQAVSPSGTHFELVKRGSSWFSPLQSSSPLS
jgi:hypothetical protein